MGLLSKAKRQVEELNNKHHASHSYNLHEQHKRLSSLQRIKEKLLEHNRKVREKLQKRLQLRKSVENKVNESKQLHQSKHQHEVKETKPYHPSSPYHTYLDEVYAQVQERGEIKLGSLADKYGASLQELESFAKILDKEKLIELYYPALGSPVLRKIGYLEEKSLEKKNKPQAESAVYLNPHLNPAAKKQRMINLALFAVLTFALMMIGYLFYLQKFGKT